MKKTVTFILAFLLLASSAYAESARTVGGITLGDNIGKYHDKVKLNTATELRDALYMMEMKLKPGAVPGTRGGSLCYTNCEDNLKVARLKLKFEDRSKKLFDELLELYTDKFGTPHSWLGNAFHTVLAWKWDIKDGDDNVEIVLMYSQLDELRPGVSIKMTLTDLWEKERACWEKTKAAAVSAVEKKESGKLLPLEAYVPH